MDRYQEVQEYINEKIKDIDNMKFYEHKVVCLFSLIDAFVQNHCSYNERNNETHFCDFILAFYDKNKYSYLNGIDPVTLTYDENNKPSLFSELEDDCIYTPESKEIGDILSNMNLSQIGPKKVNKHTYLKLLYKHRSKVTHEAQSTGLIRVESENKYDIPIYFCYGNYWKLVFPYEFLEELFLDCINNYLQYQKQHNLDPFENNDENLRKSLYAFYD